MFLSKRSSEPEQFDLATLTKQQIDDGYADLNRVNRFFRFADPFKRHIPAALGADACRSLSILDVGAGPGQMSDELIAWAATKGWNWSFVDTDVKEQSLQVARGVVCNAASLPFPDNSFDVVIATQMTHHLENDAEVIRHFAEAYRVARRLVLFYDLHRNLFMYIGIWAFCHMLRVSRQTRHDGLISVRKGWREAEWLDLARQAGIPSAQVFTEHGARIFLQAEKPRSSP